MSLKAPPRLLQLAEESLLRDEAVAIPAVEELPAELFPPLFKIAFTERRSKTLTTLVQAWPFPHLPLGSLMLAPDLEILRAVLEGLDVLLAQKVRPSGWKLQVLDLRQDYETFWSVWSGAPVRSRQAMRQRQTGEDCPGMRRQRPLKVVVDFLCLHLIMIEEFLTYVFEWAQQREDLVHLCCKRVTILGMQTPSIKKFLDMVELECVQEVFLDMVELQFVEDVKMCNFSEVYELGRFVPYLAQMKSLQNLYIAYTFEGDYIWIEKPGTEKVGQVVASFASTFLKLEKLQKLSLHGVCFLQDHLDQLVRCLKTPLESFAMSECRFSESEMKHLFLCPSMHQLKELNLRGIVLNDVNIEPLQTLLENAAATLQVLILVNCRITDSQLRVILPALSSCHQLTALNLHRNRISKAVLENVLRNTVGDEQFKPSDISCPSGVLE